jgi:isopentenyl diphosphate isomerase/L-lactate dehydrogenase-like FMN-dependent dehydrogenase
MNRIGVIISLLIFFSACSNKETNPSEETFYMPAEWELHEAVWLGWEKDSTQRYYPYIGKIIGTFQHHVKVKFLGQTLETPISLSPVGFQKFLHQEGEVATAMASASKKHQLIFSTVSNNSVSKVAAAYGPNLGIQLYPTPDRKITKILLEKAEKAGCPVCALTVETPVVGNWETSGTTLFSLIEADEIKMGNLDKILPKGMDYTDTSVTWEMIDWFRANCNMKIVIKGTYNLPGRIQLKITRNF